MNELFETDWKDANKLIMAVGDKIVDDDFVITAMNNSMKKVDTIFFEAYANAPIAIISDGGEMANAIAKTGGL